MELIVGKNKTCLIDNEDWEDLSQFNWFCVKEGRCLEERIY